MVGEIQTLYFLDEMSWILKFEPVSAHWADLKNFIILRPFQFGVYLEFLNQKNVILKNFVFSVIRSKLKLDFTFNSL